MKFIAVAAMTLDGKIAKNKDHLSTDWTSEEDKIFFRKFLAGCDVVLVGRNTYETAKEPLSKRNCIVLSRSVDQPTSESERLVFINTEKTDLKKYITNKGYHKIAILGGAQAYTYCLENNLLDELYLTIEPVVFGEGINLFSAPSLLLKKKRGEVIKTFKLVFTKKLNEQGTILLHYKYLTKPIASI